MHYSNGEEIEPEDVLKIKMKETYLNILFLLFVPLLMSPILFANFLQTYFSGDEIFAYGICFMFFDIFIFLSIILYCEKNSKRKSNCVLRKSMRNSI